MHDYNGLTPIREKFHDSGDLFALLFAQGMLAVEVETWQEPGYEPYTDIAEIAANDRSDFARLEDDGDDILFTEKDSLKVKHAGIGHSPGYLERYTFYPDGQIKLRSLENLGAPSVGDPWGGISGEESPYSEPTDAEELVIPPGQHLTFAFDNPDNEPHTPVLNIVLREYNINPLSYSEYPDVYHRIVAPGSPMPLYPVGSSDQQARYDLGDKFQVQPVQLKTVRERSR